jgi:anti-sigma B factor antagonist
MPKSKPKTKRDLNISVMDNDTGARVALSGRLSIDTSPDVRDRLLGILGQKLISAVTIDMADLSYMDCSGLATLVESLKIARERNTTMLFTGLSDGPRYFLEATGLLYLFQTDEGTAEWSLSEAS